MGTLAQFMTKDAARISSVVNSLMQVLKTPSYEVQKAVADCLVPLMPFVTHEVWPLVWMCVWACVNKHVCEYIDVGVHAADTFFCRYTMLPCLTLCYWILMAG